MKRPLVIFGAGDVAQLALYYFSKDSKYVVEGFVLDSKYIKEESYCELPVVSFEECTKHFPPSSHDMFIALGYTGINEARKHKYFEAKTKGYTLASYLSSRATILTETRIGDNCFILENNTIQPFVSIGNNVTLWSGNHIGHHSKISDHCFVTSHVVISGGVTIGESCFIGVNSTIRDRLTIGEKCVIGAGTILMTDAEPEGLYVEKSTERSKVPSTRLRKI